MNRTVLTSFTILCLLFTVFLIGLSFNIQRVKASGTIYIRADGSVEGTTDISSVDNVTYTFTGNIYDSIVVERDNIVVDGAGSTLQGTGSGIGIDLWGRSNVTIKNMEIKGFYSGICLFESSNNSITRNDITNNFDGIYLSLSLNNSISGNNITANSHFGIVLESSNNSITGNTFVHDGIFVYGGAYHNIVVDNTVNGRPLVYFEGVSDYTVDDAGQVILVGCYNIRVEGLNLSHTTVGLQLRKTNNTLISGNNITNNNYDGIHLWVSLNNSISGNNITANNYYGIVLDWDSSNNSISGNNIANNLYDGIRLWHSSNNSISGNNITANNELGIVLCDCSNNSISGNNITNNWYGIYLDSSSNNSISGNNITTNGYYGISLGGYSNYNNIIGNTLTNNFHGLTLSQPSSNNIISGNIITNNTCEGIELYVSSNNSIFGNTVTNNQYGIWLHHYSDYNHIAKNTVTNNTVGIRLSESVNHNRISGNDILANGIGIGLVAFAENNFVYHNNFINNTGQVDTYPWISNVWDSGYPSGGNYWNDYIGIDANGDGIGDTPYVIDADNQDRYPLMHPWSPLPVHNINTGLGYATIQEAINANETLDGHAIFVDEGTYFEHVVMNKTLALIGENRNSVIIDGNQTGTVVTITANNVLVSNFTIRNSGGSFLDSGIGVYSSSCNITNNKVTNNWYGTYLHMSSNNIMSGNSIANNSMFGIDLYSCSNNIISGNNIINNGYGIGLHISSNNIISENNMINNWYGFLLWCSSNNALSENNIMANSAIGIALWESSYNTINANYLCNNTGDGVWFYMSFNNTINTNQIHNNNAGISLYYSSYNNVSANDIYSNAGGISLGGDSRYNTISANQIYENAGDGIALSAYPSNNNVEMNYICNNYQGISIEFSNNNTLSRNYIANNERGIRLSISEGNLIHHNNFINNSNQAFLEESLPNTWDYGYPSGGNYWSDYIGVDVKSGPGQDLPGSDGIGDALYVIDANNVDHYPLMNPYGAPPPPMYALTITATVGGTTDPAPETYSYTANSSVQVTAISEAGYLFDHWELDNVNVGSANPYTVLMDKNHTLKAFFSSIPPPLSASISPLSASINVGQSVTFTSTVSGGYTPYSYQWHLNGAPVSGATSNTWTFTPATAGIYYVYLKVTDAKGNTAQSDTARVTVAAVPVGGYSIPIQTPATAKPLTPYLILTAILTIALTAIKRKTKRKTKHPP